MIQGVLKYKEIEFDFVLEEESLKLIPKNNYEEKFIQEFRTVLGDGAYTDKDNYIDEDYLIGQITDNYQKIIMIPKSKRIITGFFNNYLYINIQYIIYLNSSEPISKMTIYCNELNGIYDIRKAIEKNNFNKNGEAEIKLKSFLETGTDKTKFSLRKKEIQCSLNISKTLYNKITEYPVRIRSAFTLEFEPTQDYSILVDLYNIIKRFIQFLCYRKNIEIEEVNICMLDKDGRYSQIGNFNNIDEKKNQEETKVLENRFISYDYIKGCENNILQRIADDNLYMRHIPISYKEGKRENESTFIMTTAAFEWEFKKMYKEEYNFQVKQKKLKKKQKTKSKNL